MGGHIGGQVASGLAVDTLRRTYLERSSDDPRDALVAGFRNAHAAIHDYVREHPELKSMGTTCTAAVVRDFQLYYGHIGDSRLYLVHNGAISQVTRDHSMVNRLVEEGKLTPGGSRRPSRSQRADRGARHAEAARSRFFRSAARVVARRQHPDLQRRPAWPGQRRRDGPPGEHRIRRATPAVTLVEMAKQRGGHDNITVQILKLNGARAAAAGSG